MPNNAASQIRGRQCYAIVSWRSSQAPPMWNAIDFYTRYFSKKSICSSILRPGGIFPDGKGGLREDSSSCVNVTHHKCAPFGRWRRCAQPPKSDICAPTLHPSNIFCDRSKPKYCGTLLLPHLPHSYVSGLCYSGNQQRESQIFWLEIVYCVIKLREKMKHCL